MIYNQQHLIKVVIAAAGQGTRSGLEYPKTLFKIKNMPIIVRVCKALSQFDKSPSIIVAPDWKKEIPHIFYLMILLSCIIDKNRYHRYY